MSQHARELAEAMTAANPQVSGIEADAVRICLVKILSNPLFAQAERQQRFLRYLVEQALAGRSDRLKEYNIGADVFDRSDDFDPRLDSIVRVEATRLRAKLREYYDDAGTGDPIRIGIPKGSYCPTFIARESTASEGISSEPARGTVPAVSIPADKPSLAVLPFANLGADIEQEYFADGMTEELITSLSKVSGMFVIARHSVFQYKGVAKDAREIGRELGVRYLLEGSVRRSGNRIRVTAQLVEAESGVQIWAERYDRDVEDIFAMQDDVSRRIVESLAVNLAPGESESLVHGGTKSVEAHDFLLRGLERFWEYKPESTEVAQALFNKAIDLDPDYASAHAWASRACVFRYATSYAGAEALEVGLGHARRAIALNRLLPAGYSMLAWVQLWRGEVAESLWAARRAVAMDPNNADAHLFLAFVLSAGGNGEDALEVIRKGMRLNPHPSAVYLLALGQAQFVLRQYDAAVTSFRAAVDLRPEFIPAQRYLIICYALLGRTTEMAAERRILDKSFERNEPQFRDVPILFGHSDFRDEFDRGKKLAGLS